MVVGRRRYGCCVVQACRLPHTVGITCEFGFDRLFCKSAGDRMGVMKRLLRHAVLVALAILAAGSTTECRGANYSWNVSSGTWSTAADWSPSTVPGPADIAYIVNGGT